MQSCRRRAGRAAPLFAACGYGRGFDMKCACCAKAPPKRMPPLDDHNAPAVVRHLRRNGRSGSIGARETRTAQVILL